jgi:uncharacterized membrane protein YgcG
MTDAVEPDPSVPPNNLTPVTAYGVAWYGQSSKIAVLATLLDLVDRGYFGVTTEESELRPDRFDVILATRESQDATDLEPHERGVLDFFNLLIGRDPGPLRVLGRRIQRGSLNWLDRWNALQLQLHAAAEAQVSWRPGLRWLGLHTPDTQRGQAAWMGFAGWTQQPPTDGDHDLLDLDRWRQIIRYAVIFGTMRNLIDSGRIPASVMSDALGKTWWACHGRSRPLGLWQDDAYFASNVVTRPPAPKSWVPGARASGAATAAYWTGQAGPGGGHSGGDGGHSGGGDSGGGGGAW